MALYCTANISEIPVLRRHAILGFEVAVRFRVRREQYLALRQERKPKIRYFRMKVLHCGFS